MRDIQHLYSLKRMYRPKYVIAIRTDNGAAPCGTTESGKTADVISDFLRLISRTANLNNAPNNDLSGQSKSLVNLSVARAMTMKDAIGQK